MKKTIQDYQFLFMILKINIIIVFFVTINCYAIDSTLKYIDIKNNSYLLEDNDSTIIVFANNYNCKNCFYELNNVLKEYKKNYKIISIIRTNSITMKLEMRNAINTFKGLIEVENFYFDIHTTVDNWPPLNLKEGLFEKFKISKTPALLIRKKNQNIFISYEELFGIRSNLEKIIKEKMN